MDQERLHDPAIPKLRFGSQAETDPSPGPIHHIPTELLIKIFEYHVEEDRHSSVAPYGSTDQLKGPWPLSKVCRDWRNIVISTPSLWSYIHVCSTHEKNNAINIVNIQLERSQDVSLIVHLEETRGNKWNLFPDYRVLAEMIIRQHQRWKEFVLMDMGWDIYYAMHSSGVCLPVACPLLQSLHLTGAYPHPELHTHFNDPMPPLIVSSGVPALNKAGFIFTHPPPAFPWEQLRALEINRMTASFFEILPQLTSLEHLTITVWVSTSSRTQRIGLPKLEELVLDQALSIADFIQTPALKHLVLGWMTVTQEHLEHIIALVNASGCFIETFTCSSPSSINFEKSWAAMPALRTLSVTLMKDNYDWDIFSFPSFKAFLDLDYDGSFKYCPRLENLSIAWSRTSSVALQQNISSLIDMLEKRSRMGSASKGSWLKRVEFDAKLTRITDGRASWAVLSGEHKRRLLALREEGMILTVKFNGNLASIG